jgi:hypothetical protein
MRLEARIVARPVLVFTNEAAIFGRNFVHRPDCSHYCCSSAVAGDLKRGNRDAVHHCACLHGYGIVAVFVIGWLASALLYKMKGYDREAASA